MIQNKKSQSELISTVILILISIAAAGIILAFVVPYIRDKLSSSDCTDVAGKLDISSSGYTCYNLSGSIMQVQVHFGDISEKVNGIVLELGGATTASKKIINNTLVSGVSMYDDTPTLYLPNNNEERTYKIPITMKPTSVKLYAVMKNGQTCDASSSINTVDGCFVM